MMQELCGEFFGHEKSQDQFQNKFNQGNYQGMHP
jgi:hypothetical protein